MYGSLFLLRKDVFAGIIDRIKRMFTNVKRTETQKESERKNNAPKIQYNRFLSILVRILSFLTGNTGTIFVIARKAK